MSEIEQPTTGTAVPKPRDSDLTLDRLELSRPVDAEPSHPAAHDPLRDLGVLIVGANYAPEAIGVGPHTTSMARSLAAITARVTVFTGIPHNPAGSLPLVYRRNRRSYGSDAKVDLVRHRHHIPTAQGGVGRLRFELGFARAVLATPVRHVPDLVIGVMPSVGGGFAAARLAERFSVPLVVVLQELAGARRLEGGLVGAAIARRQAWALRQATRVVIVREELRAAVRALGVGDGRIDLVANWSFNPTLRLDRRTARARLGLPKDGFLVIHSGNIGFGQDVPTVVRAARRLAGRGPDVGFLLVGDGSQRKALELATADLPGVMFLDPVNAQNYPVLLAAADVLVLNERPGHPDRTLPSKLRSYLLAGRAIVAAVNPDSETDQALRAVPGAALTVMPGDAQALAAALARLRDGVQECDRMGVAANSFAESAVIGTTVAGGLRDVVRNALLQH
jgi:colanic acid biosynthesis glycosyl transferase WcaI